ncbi:MAG: LPS export ABC transporter periplasmic protein LptC [Vulcanimicrobiota bacterium]
MKKQLKTRNFYLAIFVILLLFIPGCSNRARELEKKIKSPSPTPTEEIKQAAPPQPPVEFTGTTIKSRNDTATNWKLEAKQVDYSETEKFVQAEAVETVFYNDRGTPVFTVVARGARVNLEDDSLKFEGKVTAHTNTGEKIHIAELKWDGERKKLIGSKSVKIVRKDSFLTAEGMTADPSLNEIVLEGNVTIEYADEENILNRTDDE